MNDENLNLQIDKPDVMTMHERPFRVVRLLGKGKGGYSWLVTDEQGNEFVLKQIHHEPCEYYHFENKLQSEVRDYIRLSNLHLPLPRLLEVDEKHERILKEYIPGPTIMELSKAGGITEDHIDQLKKMLEILYPENLNIDYYPTNFVVNPDGQIFYVDYECNLYHQEWDYEHWGHQFWKNEASSPKDQDEAA